MFVYNYAFTIYPVSTGQFICSNFVLISVQLWELLDAVFFSSDLEEVPLLLSPTSIPAFLYLYQ